MPEIENLSIQVSVNARDAKNGLDELEESLGRIRTATAGGLGLAAVVEELKDLKNEATGLGSASTGIKALADALDTLGKVTIPGNLATSLTDLCTAINGFKVDSDSFTKLKQGLTDISGVQVERSLASRLKKLGEALASIDDAGILRLVDLGDALKNLPDKSNISSSIARQIEKIGTALGGISSGGITTLQALMTALSQIVLLKNVKFPTGVISGLSRMATVADQMKGKDFSGISKMASALRDLIPLNGVSISTSIGNQIRAIGQAVSSLAGVDMRPVEKMANSLSKLTKVAGLKLSSNLGTQLTKIAAAVRALDGQDVGVFKELANSLKPLGALGKSNLGSYMNQLKKLPDIMRELSSVNMSGFASDIEELVEALRPLETMLASLQGGISGLPQQLKNLANAANTGNSKKSGGNAFKWLRSFVDVKSLVQSAIGLIRSAADTVSDFVDESNQYVEDLNLFTAAMGEYASEAKSYAEEVGAVMGIDPADWMRNQGVFMTIATGFGIASDKAATMSEQLTQLGYDISSFYNISVEDAMAKLGSGLAGELEPLRRIGYDLSKSSLEGIAEKLGITKDYDDMTQAEKAALRYYAIMTQVTTVQGDMARTLDSPSNQLRILQAQLTQCARAIGNIFIPMLNRIVPYALAVMKVIRALASTIASVMGFSLPEVDYSGISAGGQAVEDTTENVEDLDDSLGGATGRAKKLKDALMGFDELNVINPQTNSGGGGGASVIPEVEVPGWTDFDLPTYDFLNGAITKNVDRIYNKIHRYIRRLKSMIDIEAIVAWVLKEVDNVKKIVTDICALIHNIGLDTLVWDTIKKTLSFADKTVDFIANNFRVIADLAIGVGGAVLMWKVSSKVTGGISGLFGREIAELLKGLGVGKLKELMELVKTGGKGVLATVAIGTIVAVLNWTLANEFLDTGNAFTIVAQGLTTALGGILSYATVSSALKKMGVGAGGQKLGGKIAAAVTLAISAALSITAAIKDVEKNGITLKNIFEALFGSMAAAGTGALVASMIGKSAVIGGVIGLGVAVVATLIFGGIALAKYKKNEAQEALYGKLKLTTDEIQALVDSMFTFDVQATINLVNEVKTNRETAIADLNEKVANLNSELIPVIITGKLDEETVEQLQQQIDGVIQQVETALESNNKVINVAMSVVPHNSSSTGLSQEYGILDFMGTSTAAIQSTATEIGQMMGDALAKSAGGQLEGELKQIVLDCQEWLNKLERAVTFGKQTSAFQYGTEVLLSNLTKDTFGQTMTDYYAQVDELRKSFTEADVAARAAFAGNLEATKVALDYQKQYHPENTELIAELTAQIQEAENILANWDVEANVEAAIAEAIEPGKKLWMEAIATIFAGNFANDDKVKKAVNKQIIGIMDPDSDKPEEIAEEVNGYIDAIIKAITGDENVTVLAKSLGLNPMQLIGSDYANVVLRAMGLGTQKFEQSRENLQAADIFGINGWNYLTDETRKSLYEYMEAALGGPAEAFVWLEAADIYGISGWNSWEDDRRQEVYASLVNVFGDETMAKAFLQSLNLGIDVSGLTIPTTGTPTIAMVGQAEVEYPTVVTTPASGDASATPAVIQAQAQATAASTQATVQLGQASVKTTGDVTELNNAIGETALNTLDIDWTALGVEAASQFKAGWLSVKMPQFSVTWTNSVTNINGQDVNVPVPSLSFYAKGGFPRDGEMFVANEAGPEMVGRIGSRTAVANSGQIVEGIASGVTAANDEGNSLLREQNTLLRQLLAKESSVKITPSVALGRVNAQSASMYARMAGGKL